MDWWWFVYFSLSLKCFTNCSGIWINNTRIILQCIWGGCILIQYNCDKLWNSVIIRTATKQKSKQGECGFVYFSLSLTTKSKQTIINRSGDVAYVHISIKENDKWRILWVRFLKYTKGFNNDTHKYLISVSEFLRAST
jgi:hypothetical protein